MKIAEALKNAALEPRDLVAIQIKPLEVTEAVKVTTLDALAAFGQGTRRLSIFYIPDTAVSG